MNLYVGNLLFNVTENELKELFEPFGFFLFTSTFDIPCSILDIHFLIAASGSTSYQISNSLIR